MHKCVLSFILCLYVREKNSVRGREMEREKECVRERERWKERKGELLERELITLC